jgi:hypothetical protein
LHHIKRASEGFSPFVLYGGRAIGLSGRKASVVTGGGKGGVKRIQECFALVLRRHDRQAEVLGGVSLEDLFDIGAARHRHDRLPLEAVNCFDVRSHFRDVTARRQKVCVRV